jgi:hypothetical protein
MFLTRSVVTSWPVICYEISAILFDTKEYLVEAIIV